MFTIIHCFRQINNVLRDDLTLYIYRSERTITSQSKLNSRAEFSGLTERQSWEQINDIRRDNRERYSA